MDLKKIGLFISVSRKDKGYTQKELADKIGVTDKAVSRWETGRGFPDVSSLKLLSEVLEVSITEIINGEAASPETIEEKADNALIEALAYSKEMGRKAIAIVMIILGIGLIAVPPLFMAGSGLPFFMAVGAVTLVLGIIVLCYKKPFFRTRSLRLRPRMTGAASILVVATIIFLQTLPYGAVLVFSDGPGSQIRRTFSYFSLAPFGYANFFPLITAILTVVILVLTVVAFIKNYKAKRIQDSAFICTVIAIIVSTLSWILFGLQYITGVGIAISVLLAASLVLQAFSNRVPAHHNIQ